ncbi:MAG: hypothetical protein ACRD13_00075 [Terriglobales bacterium]
MISLDPGEVEQTGGLHGAFEIPLSETAQNYRIEFGRSCPAGQHRIGRGDKRHGAAFSHPRALRARGTPSRAAAIGRRDASPADAILF